MKKLMFKNWPAIWYYEYPKIPVYPEWGAFANNNGEDRGEFMFTRYESVLVKIKIIGDTAGTKYGDWTMQLSYSVEGNSKTLQSARAQTMGEILEVANTWMEDLPTILASVVL